MSTDPQAASSAKKLAGEAVDVATSVVTLARDIPLESAKVLLNALHKAVAALETATKGK